MVGGVQITHLNLSSRTAGKCFICVQLLSFESVAKHQIGQELNLAPASEHFVQLLLQDFNFPSKYAT
jgi:hypothetical protein